MANQLKMAKIQAIRALHEQRWSQRQIAGELDVERETVAKYVRAGACIPKPAKAPIGSDGEGGRATEGSQGPPLGSASGGKGEVEVRPPTSVPGGAVGSSKPAKAPIGSESKPAKAPIGSEPVSGAFVSVQVPPGSVVGIEASTATNSLEEGCSRSACEPYRQVILQKLELGLSAQRIYQDLVGEGFDHEYHSVRRFVAKLRKTSPLPFRRMECEAGEEAQVDFGTGAWIDLPGGKRRRSHVFRIVLSFSRKGYSEATYHQTTEDFIRALENAFWHFGGVPKVLIIDNLKAAVKHPDWYDPELNPKVQGVLLGAARVLGPHALGAVGPAAGADLHQPHGADRRARAAGAGPFQHSGPAHRRPEAQRRGAWGSASVGSCPPDRRAHGPLGRGHDPDTWDRGRSGPARAVKPDAPARLRGDRAGLRSGLLPRGLSAADDPSTLETRCP